MDVWGWEVCRISRVRDESWVRDDFWTYIKSKGK